MEQSLMISSMEGEVGPIESTCYSCSTCEFIPLLDLLGAILRVRKKVIGRKCLCVENYFNKFYGLKR